MNVAKNLTHQVFRRQRMRQHRPVGPRDIRALNRTCPKIAQVFDVARLSELADRRSMAAIQGLLQQLGGMIPAPGQKHGLAVEFVI